MTGSTTARNSLCRKATKSCAHCGAAGAPEPSDPELKGSIDTSGADGPGPPPPPVLVPSAIVACSCCVCVVLCRFPNVKRHHDIDM